jgi:hypothetical protein
MLAVPIPRPPISGEPHQAPGLSAKDTSTLEISMTYRQETAVT